MLLLSALLLSPVTGFADSSTWRDITYEQKKSCTKEAPCRFSPDGKAQFHVIFHTQPDRDYPELRLIERVEFINLNGKSRDIIKIPQVDGVPRIQGLSEDDQVGFYLVNLRDPKVFDLALSGLDSMKLGPLYYYFLWDAKNQRFVMTNEALPSLKPVVQKGVKLLTDGESKYEIGKDLRIKSK